MATPALQDRLSQARDHLDKYKLVEAEELFQQVIQNATTAKECKHEVEAYNGLSELYCKRARVLRYDPMEWNRMYMHAVTFQTQAVNTCVENLETTTLQELQHWLREQKSNASSKLSALNKCWMKSLQDHLIWTQPKHAMPDAISRTPRLNMNFLDNLQHHITHKNFKQISFDRRPSLLRQESIDEVSDVVPESPVFKTVQERQEEHQINVDRVQKAITKLARRLSAEIQTRQLTIHKSMTPDEKLKLVSPLADISFIDQFRDAMKESRSPSPEKEEKKDVPEVKEIFDSDEDLSDLEADSEHSNKENKKPRDSPEEKGLKHGVYRIWKSYRKASPPTSLALEPYKLQIFEEISPVTEAFKTTFSQGSQRNADKGTLTQAKLNNTFGDVLFKIGKKLEDDKHLMEAHEVYTYALGLYKQNPQDASTLVPVGNILCQIAVIKCRQGDFFAGTKLLEESIQMFERAHGNKRNLDTARAWSLLGSVYLEEHWREGSLFEHVMLCVQDSLESENHDQESREYADEDSDDEDSSSGESYSVSTYEAIGCLSHALSILQSMPHSPANDQYNDLYVEVLTRLGDCSIMAGEYDRAVLCYEEALYLFKHSYGSSALPNNAHVLAMLGTASYLLCNFPKAVSMYETAHVFQQHLYGADDINFEMAFTLTMLGLCHYKMRHFHKCIAWCLKAYDFYTTLYIEFEHIEIIKRWFITQTLFTLGYSYSTLNFHEKALYYLKMSQQMVININEEMVIKQMVRILKAIADVYNMQEEHENSLQFYNQALEIVHCLGDERSATALQNQLLNCMAGVHVSTKEYSTAANYLQQALGHQKQVENSIKGDMVDIIQQLGMTYILAGDLTKAIECFLECIEAYRESHITTGCEIAKIYANLGTLHHVKACLQEDNEDYMNLLSVAEHYFLEGLKAEKNSSVCVQYANYLYQQGQYFEALETMFYVVHSSWALELQPIKYSGVEQAVLPEHIQADIDDLDEASIDAVVFAKYLAILCYKNIGFIKEATDCLLDLYNLVYMSSVPLDHSIMGYSLLEMGCFPEAAESFAAAASLQKHESALAHTNFWISICVWVYMTYVKVIFTMLEFSHIPIESAMSPRSPGPDFRRRSPEKHQKDKDMLKVEALVQHEYIKLSNETIEEGEDVFPQATRDSGYYDHNVVESEDRIKGEHYEYNRTSESLSDVFWETSETETVMTSPDIVRLIIAQQRLQERGKVPMVSDMASSGVVQSLVDSQNVAKSLDFADQGYTSKENLEREGLEDYSPWTFETWNAEQKVKRERDDLPNVEHLDRPETFQPWDYETWRKSHSIDGVNETTTESSGPQNFRDWATKITNQDFTESKHTITEETIVTRTAQNVSSVYEKPAIKPKENETHEEWVSTETVEYTKPKQWTTTNIVQSTQSDTVAVEGNEETSEEWVSTKTVEYTEPKQWTTTNIVQNTKSDTVAVEGNEETSEEWVTTETVEYTKPESNTESEQYEEWTTTETVNHPTEKVEEEWITEETVEYSHAPPPPPEEDEEVFEEWSTTEVVENNEEWNTEEWTDEQTVVTEEVIKEDWHESSEVVATPPEVLAMMKKAREDQLRAQEDQLRVQEDQLRAQEEWKTSTEVVVTKSEISSVNGTVKSDKPYEEEWITEETVEYSKVPPQEEEKETFEEWNKTEVVEHGVNEEWTTEEWVDEQRTAVIEEEIKEDWQESSDVVETPPEILAMMRKAQESQLKETNITKSSYEKWQPQDQHMKETQKEEFSDTWTTTENVEYSPVSVESQDKSNSSKTAEEWVTTEEVVTTVVSNHQQSHYQSNVDHQNNVTYQTKSSVLNSNDNAAKTSNGVRVIYEQEASTQEVEVSPKEEEETWQTWEVEEVVETPPEILRALMASQGRT